MPSSLSSAPARHVRTAQRSEAPGGPAGRMRGEWIDRLAGSDPGLNRLRLALQSVATIAAILVAEKGFVVLTHALQINTHGAVLPPAAAAKVAFANHSYTVIAMLLGAIIGMISTFSVMDATARGQLVTMLLLPLPMTFALFVGIALGGHRVLALTSLAVALAVGTYLRRFGPRGFVAGSLLFMGDFFGFFLHGVVVMAGLGWLVAELCIGVGVAILIRFLLFYPRPAKALARTERSYGARARKVAALALELFDDPEHSDRRARHLRRQLVRLNEAALMIDAQLSDDAAVAVGSSAQRLHQRLFDIELALSNVARFAQTMTRMPLPASHRDEARRALRGIVDGDPVGASAHAQALVDLLRAGPAAGTSEARTVMIVTHRFAVSIAALAEAQAAWTELGAAVKQDAACFTPSVLLFGGWLPGSTGVSAAASQEAGTRLGDRTVLAPWTRAAIQIGIAVGAAIAIGDLLSGRRFYWAVIAAFITFMGANNTGEQVRKAVLRVLGTVVGITVGSLLVHLTGHHNAASLAVILLALFFAFYLMRVNYAFMVIGITVMVSQLYAQLDEFSNALLLLRLEETAIGAGVAIVTVLLVLPLRTHRVVRVALRGYLEALTDMVDHASTRLLRGPGQAGDDLRSDARQLDAAYQALLASVLPLRRTFSGELEERLGTATRVASATRNYARNLVVDAEAAQQLDAPTVAALADGRQTLLSSMELVGTAVTGARNGTYLRSASLFDEAEQALERCSGAIGYAQLALRDLALLDGALASLAGVLRLNVDDLDTRRFAPSLVSQPG